MKKRLFVALNTNKGIQTELEKIIKKLRITFDQKEIEIKWSLIENLHVTLVFLGNVEIQKIDLIKKQIEQVCLNHEPFQLRIENMSGFPETTAARVVVLQVQRSQKILDLQSELEQTLGLMVDKEYSPHMTIGRLRNPKSIKDATSPFARKKFGKVDISEVVLMESHVNGPYPTYKALAHFPLKEVTDENVTKENDAEENKTEF